MSNKPASIHPADAAQASRDVVDSLNHPLAVTIRQLLTRTEKIALDRIIIDDEENILEALRSNVAIEALFHAGDEGVSEPLGRALPAHVAVHEVAKRTCKKLFENDKISRLFAIARTPPPRPLESLADVERDILVLEDVSIAGNIGAIIRTSLALGAGGLVLLGMDPVDVFDRRIIRASRGHVFSLPVVTATTEAFLEFCKRRELPLLVTTPHADKMLPEIADLPGRLVMVFGSEKHGCSRRLEDAATLRAKIPMSSKVESLNVSVAASIALYSRVRFNGLLPDV